LRFRIEALMYAEPAPERVSFDSLLDPSSQSFSVTGARDG
jgi:predicted component of type VI protein secretion system